MSGPWEFDVAREHARAASQAQIQAEEFVKHAAKDLALKEEAYRKALAERIVELRAEGNAATLCADLARGDVKVARLRRDRDIAEGVRDAAVQASWRRSADRRDTQSFLAWSMRRELAEGAGDPQWTEAAA
jgi:hypothetical protein